MGATAPPLQPTMAQSPPASLTTPSPDRKPSSKVKNCCVLCEELATTGKTVRFPCRIGANTLYSEREASPPRACFSPAPSKPNNVTPTTNATNNLDTMLSSPGGL